jgi:hypothetical protein
LEAPHIPKLKKLEIPKTLAPFENFIVNNRKITAVQELPPNVQKSYDQWYENF